MIPRILITFFLLWVKVMSFNFPCCWDSLCQTWKINQNPSNEPNVVYVMPPESSQSMGISPSCQSQNTTCKNRWNDLQQLKCNNCCDCCNDGKDLIIIDTDCDAADAMAISMILNCTRNKLAFTVAGITCTWGSTDINNVFKNVIKTLKACDRFCEIPVYGAGSDRGLVEAKSHEPSEYGLDAFGDFYYFSENDKHADKDFSREHPAIFMTNLVRQNPGKVKIVCMGPMVNIALAAHIHSGFYKDVKEILYLGGSMNASGKYQGVSWNDLLDPYASMAVFNKDSDTDSEDPKITICIDECHKDTYFLWDWRNKLGDKNPSVMKLLNFAERKKLDKKHIDGWNCDSPFLAAVLLDRRIFSEVVGRCSVEISGQMQIDTDSDNPNVRVIQKADEAKLERFMDNCF